MNYESSGKSGDTGMCRRISLGSPSAIEVLLHCHYSLNEHPRKDAPAIKETIHMLFTVGAISQIPSLSPADVTEVYQTTPLGRAWVQALCNVPIPTEAFLDEAGRVLK